MVLLRIAYWKVAENRGSIHAVVLNATQASDGKWHAVHNDALYKHQHLLGAIQNAELRSRIETLGYETVPAKNPVDGSFEIKGINRDVVEAYSTRSAEIKAHLADGDRSSPRERELAALATRNAKEPALSPDERKVAWGATAERVEFDPAPLIAASRAREATHDTVWSRLGEGAVTPIAQGNDVSARLQDAARDIGLRRLNEGQEKAGAAVLTSIDRIHLVQGSAGTGKSAALGPVAAIAKEQGLNVIALAHSSRTAKDFGAKVEPPRDRRPYLCLIQILALNLARLDNIGGQRRQNCLITEFKA